jgi:HK97 family phage portal protein
MGVISKLANIGKVYERGANYELGQSLSSTSVSTLFGTGGAGINVLEEYSGIAWKCIDIRADRLADQDLFIERYVGQKWQPDIQHEFNKVLEGGEGQHDLSELLEAHEKSMCLYGESFWYFSKAENQRKPYSVYLLDPAAMTVMVSGNKVIGYVYQKESERIALDLDEIAHYKIYDWRHPFRGTGPMQSAGWFIRSARYTTTFVNNFMENNAIPAGVIVAKGDVDDKDWTLFKSEWTSRYGGISNSGKTGFVRGSDLDFVKTGMSLGDVDFEKIKNSDRADIMVMFGISKPMMAIFDDINRASAVTAERLFAKSLTSPSLKRISRKLSKKVAEWYGPQFQIGSTDPVPEDDEIKFQRLEKGTNVWLTVNEARAADGLEPLGPEYDKIISNVSAPVAPKSYGKVKIKTITKQTGFSYEMKESFRSEAEDIQLKYEQEVLQATHPLLTEQKEAVLNQLAPKKIAEANFNVDKEAEKLADATVPLFVALAKEQGILAATFVGNDHSQFVLTPPMEKYISDSVRSSALSFTTETQVKIATALKEGLEAGESINKIKQRISSVYEDVTGIKTPGYRIERLARTEVIKTSNEITEAAYKQSGVVQKKEWLANPGACEFCRALNGSTIQLGGTYVPKGDSLVGEDGGTYVSSYESVQHPPVHPTCRCTLIPVIERQA